MFLLEDDKAVRIPRVYPYKLLAIERKDRIFSLSLSLSFQTNRN